MGDNYCVYVTDFGFARLKDDDKTFNTTKSTIGPVKYMSPEALEHKVKEIISKYFISKLILSAIFRVLWQFQLWSAFVGGTLARKPLLELGD